MVREFICGFIFRLEMGGGVVMKGKVVGEGLKQLLLGAHLTVSSWLPIRWVPLIHFEGSNLLFEVFITAAGKFK